MTDTLFPLPESSSQTSEDCPGKPRLETANRQQISMRLAALDDLLPEDHRARIVWEMVQNYDMGQFYARVGSLEGKAGRPAIDPRLLIAVWLYATLEGVMSARELAHLCEEHLAYQWLLGGVSVNYHTLADFRVDYEAELDDLLTKSVAALMFEGLVTIEKTAQDGMRIRASAGASSFRRKLDRILREPDPFSTTVRSNQTHLPVAFQATTYIPSALLGCLANLIAVIPTVNQYMGLRILYRFEVLNLFCRHINLTLKEFTFLVTYFF